MMESTEVVWTLDVPCLERGNTEWIHPRSPLLTTSIHLLEDIKALGWGGELRRDKFWIFGFVADEV